MDVNPPPTASFDLRILFVDDNPSSVQPAIDEIKLRFQNPQARQVSFDDAQATIRKFAPHLVVLDLREEATGDLPVEAGEAKVLNFIWDHRFCPVVVYSAFPDQLVDTDKTKHPFVKLVKKGAQSEVVVADHVRDFVPYLEALDEVANEVGRVLNHSLREVAEGVFTTTTAAAERQEHLTRSVRRRVAAKMDERLTSGAGPKLAAWEHYLCPPVAVHLLTGDVLIQNDGDPNSPEAFYVILSPSCDLVKEEKREPKVDYVLTAKCKPVSRLLEDAGLSANTKAAKVKERIKPVLTQGYGPSCLPLPALKGVFPAMVADFRSLELLSIKDLGDTTDCKYRRVASVDNPFRNLVSWAYGQCAARPGLPDRDFDSWAEEFIAEPTEAS